jgi:tetratricopeptide (TPR) repeat protein
MFKNLYELPDDIVKDFKNKRYNICKEKCNNFLISNPNSGLALMYLGKIAESEQDYETAIRYYKKVTIIVPRLPFIWSYIGENYMSLEKYNDAYDAYKEELALIPYKVEPWCMLFLVAYKMGNNELAMGILKMAQERVEKEGQSTISYLIGTLEESVGNKDEALMNYLHSQILAKDAKSRDIPANLIYEMLKSQK